MKTQVHHFAIRLITAFSLLAVMLLAFGSCSTRTQKDGKDTLSVSILPQQYFAERICGDLFHIQTMIPPGESPATYDPSPEQMMNLSRSTVYFLVGHLQFETTWIRKAAGDHPGVTFVDTSEGLELELEQHTGHDHDHGPVDPHTWMSARNVRVITQTMADELAKQYPEHQAVFDTNLAAFHEEISALDRQIKQNLDTLKSRSFIIYHPALTYFAREYGLEQLPIEREGKEPSARYLKTLVDVARKNGIKAILVQQQFNQEEARIMEKEIGGRVITIDPLAHDWKSQMLAISQALQTALNTP